MIKRSSLQGLSALVAGLIFGVGLAASEMNNSARVQAFLDVFGEWDPSLAFVMAAALAIAIPGFQWLLKRKPLLDEDYHLPHKQLIDRPLIIGSCLFGLGWAIVGYCPGPAVASLAYLDGQTLVFVIAMLAGAKLRQWQQTGKTGS